MFENRMGLISTPGLEGLVTGMRARLQAVSAARGQGPDGNIQRVDIT